MDWDKAGVFISLITPLLLGVGAWIISAVSKRKAKKELPAEVIQGLPVDYETDYVKLLNQNLTDLRRENNELKKKIKALESRKE